MNSKEEAVVFNIISSAGEASAHFLKAIKLAEEEGEFKKAYEELKKGEEVSLAAHKEQTKLIQREVSGEKIETGILMIHAQDHLMNSILLKDLAKSIVSLNEKLYRSK
ncbi:PTS lactose/cellobiose transporter subunit IIA [Clostridium oceanicum]|uniref:PTS lactose/cellobiose transporter subunit IIA n=1 Tax=Clostridium oceanicum TaxID=1543 RepID=A0ABN1J839_9CLOT